MLVVGLVAGELLPGFASIIRAWPFVPVTAYASAPKDMRVSEPRFAVLEGETERGVLEAGLVNFSQLLCFQARISGVTDAVRAQRLVVIDRYLRARSAGRGYRGLRVYDSVYDLRAGVRRDRARLAEFIWN